MCCAWNAGIRENPVSVEICYASIRRQWLLIVDNANGDTAPRIREILPSKNAKGSILMTTRTKHSQVSGLRIWEATRVYCAGNT